MTCMNSCTNFVNEHHVLLGVTQYYGTTMSCIMSIMSWHCTVRTRTCSTSVRVACTATGQRQHLSQRHECERVGGVQSVHSSRFGVTNRRCDHSHREHRAPA